MILMGRPKVAVYRLLAERKGGLHRRRRSDDAAIAAYSGRVDRLFRRNVTGDSGEVAPSDCRFSRDREVPSTPDTPAWVAAVAPVYAVKVPAAAIAQKIADTRVTASSLATRPGTIDAMQLEDHRSHDMGGRFFIGHRMSGVTE